MSAARDRDLGFLQLFVSREVLGTLPGSLAKKSEAHALARGEF
jgi:hypothetical protein